MLGGVRVAGTGGGHQHHGHRHLAAGEIGVLGHQVVDGVHADAEEVDEHQLDDRPHAVRSGAHRGTDEGRFGDRRVADARLAELFIKATGVAEHTAELADVLAHHEHLRVQAHLLRHGFGHGAGDGEFSFLYCCGHGGLLLSRPACWG